ncbi:GntR family transcriptional regulator [Streptomyces sp. NBC_01433]|uniref:GntR family transcriptional regulator n=1 Tax=Streptomyces sp. NBC_01433 TaxID=2903864 RepID=UPI00225B8994|nr:GntR family transcriptional regulator [Streptomyces sp. NBC_01433]MCX4681311.1 GntR family transcriptional regulator [Streptomyces sp. NBC_01433]MCX4682388.1 GntR family transcriptional regulator [Streptomyces sp. NBC_01433]
MVTDIRISAYLKVAAAIRHRISLGEFEVGSKLPTQKSFARQYRVSDTVVRSAMDVLTQEGRVRPDAYSAALYVSEEGPDVAQSELAQAFRRLEVVEVQLAQLLNGSSPAAPTVQGQGVGVGAWLERSVSRGVAVLRGTGGVLARLGFRGGRVHGSRAA